MKTVLLPIFWLFAFATVFAQQVKVASGTVQRFENFPSKLVDPRNVDAWLPESYDVRKKYAVLYMHDGQMLFDSTTTWNRQEWGVDETVGRLIREGKIRDCIIVGIWNNGSKRHSEYFPQKPFESLSQAQRDSILKEARNAGNGLFADKIQSDNYLKFIVTELKPFIDSRFSTKKDRKNTFVAGSSMGGLISLYAICEYPEVFGGAACISTHWPGIFRAENNPIPAAFLQYMKTKLPSPKKHKIYFDCGTAGLDAMYPPVQKQADDIMRAKGFSSKNWLTRVFEGEDHSERAWQKRLDIPLVFLLKK